MKVQITKQLSKQALPTGYSPLLDFFQTEKAIKLVKDVFERKLAKKLCLLRVSAPRFLMVGKGLQDDLAGTQVPVSFKAKFSEQPLEVVHSLAKWKRYALSKYSFKHGTGLYTDMDAIRKDEDISPIHSIYVDQWDWERVMSKEERSLKFLKQIVRSIYAAIVETEAIVAKEFPELKPRLPKEIMFVHSEELEEKYPGLTPKQREDTIAKEHGAVFIIGIGYPLKSGKPHDLRAADYDDWSTPTARESGKETFGLDGDILVWHPERKKALELSSMGIRVDKKALLRQLEMMGLEQRKELEFHKGVLEGKIPLSIGGGIGQSRLCMALLQKAHIAEVQSSAWPEEVHREFARKGVPLL
ncbi:aspartate--ammonia ligase [Candidatus Woesearchaeota archaeon]|nr:aspartate--ammonia ligase [Candidatus Woesearchaeota archaeon]